MRKNRCDKSNYILMKPSYLYNHRFKMIGYKTTKLYSIPKNRPVRIYCSGIYDLFHYGHVNFLMQVKHLFPKVELIVGINNDKITQKYKGQTVMNEIERLEGVKHCKYINDVVENAPWEPNKEFLKKYKIDFIAHDTDSYSPDEMTILDKSADNNSNIFIPTIKIDGISTTKIITTILKNYNMFLERQIDRGVSYKELNVSFMKIIQIKTRKFINMIIKKILNK